MKFVPQQTGWGESKIEVGDAYGKRIGWIVTVTHPKKHGGMYKMANVDPVPTEEKAAWYLNQFKREITEKLQRAAGFCRTGFESYLDMTKIETEQPLKKAA